MHTYDIIPLRENPQWRIPAARWFHEKWNIPMEEYLTSIDECIRGASAVPQWYVAVEGEKIIAGAGVIENDFHDRKDLAPNVCALYVEPEHRKRGIAGRLLAHICTDMPPERRTHSISSRNTRPSTNATDGNASAPCAATTAYRCGCTANARRQRPICDSMHTPLSPR